MSKYQIQRYKTTLTIPDGGNTIDSAAVGLNGLLKGIIPVVPALTSAGTLTVTIKDKDGYTVFSKSSIASSTSTGLFVDSNNQPYELPLSGDHTITVTASGNQTGAKNISVVLLIQRG